MIQVKIASKTIVGTNTEEILSAKAWIGAFELYAFSTSFVIWL